MFVGRRHSPHAVGCSRDPARYPSNEGTSLRGDGAPLFEHPGNEFAGQRRCHVVRSFHGRVADHCWARQAADGLPGGQTGTFPRQSAAVNCRVSYGNVKLVLRLQHFLRSSDGLASSGMDGEDNAEENVTADLLERTLETMRRGRCHLESSRRVFSDDALKGTIYVYVLKFFAGSGGIHGRAGSPRLAEHETREPAASGGS